MMNYVEPWEYQSYVVSFDGLRRERDLVSIGVYYTVKKGEEPPSYVDFFVRRLEAEVYAHPKSAEDVAIEITKQMLNRKIDEGCLQPGKRHRWRIRLPVE